ncbi:NADH dehydrogenase [ubiquinone] iron-sulfur protein 4, mitochondrial [Phymastichus coffea]|uniref:NADH dehydrogenase [ubiquinone] iron-sulfur protein 4, mitochondrial n=1 Tax=Phymastichus coffea TaxID=108790 RepID=UPI00273BB444|nr:NADH dehydrogenase [ubiquinone] iron-sulfur protein 4, mitochondrial [Phymastichus coffea]
MGSRALLGRCLTQLVNGNQTCKYLSSSAVLGAKDTANINTTSQIHEAPLKPIDSFFTPPSSKEHSEKMKGLITIESEENYVGIVSGVPEEHIKTRTVYIYQPAKNAMQSGTNNINFWQISFDTRERWENRLMGWCSSGDPLQATRVNFQTEQEAVEHCKRMGWNYIVRKPNRNDPKPRSYGNNFSWNKRTRVSTK